MTESGLRLFRQPPQVPSISRAALLGQRPCCVWLTGLSGAGKSTLASALDLRLHQEKLSSYLLDGDNVRHGLCSDLDMSEAARRENIRRLAEVARLMCDAGLVTIVSAISPYRAEREAARSLFAQDDFICVHVSTPLAVCAERDPKGLYQAAREGRIRNFTGMDSPYEPPLDADLELDTSCLDQQAAVDRLYRRVLERCRPR
ncbi:MAG TPA: adenylyl-sulfate kinase [Pseudomonas sp.]